MRLSDIKIGSKYSIAGDCPEEARITGSRAVSIHRERCYRHATVTVQKILQEKVYVIPNLQKGAVGLVLSPDELFQT